MLRYFKRNLPIAVAAGLTSILTQLSTPVAAMLEQRLVDNIIARDFQGFSNQLLYSGLLVLVSALLYWLSAEPKNSFRSVLKSPFETISLKRPCLNLTACFSRQIPHSR